MYKIDLKDRKILYELDINARQTLSQIGKNVLLPKSVVAYRIKTISGMTYDVDGNCRFEDFRK